MTVMKFVQQCLKHLEMSVTYFYMLGSNNLDKDILLKPPRQAYVHCVTLNMQEDDKC